VAGKIDTSGLRALRKAFKNTGSKDFDKHLRAAHVKIAEQVIAAARPGVAAQSSRVAASMQPVRSAVGARIRVGGPDLPWTGGLLFGAMKDQERRTTRGTMKGWNQFRPWTRGEAYHIWPEVDQVRDEIADTYTEGVHDYLTAQGVPR